MVVPTSGLRDGKIRKKDVVGGRLVYDDESRWLGGGTGVTL
jgi:hypothetical protein